MTHSRRKTILMATALTALGGTFTAASADTMKIGFITKFPGGFFATLENGGKDFAAKHPEIELIFGQAKSGTDAEGEIAIIESMITQGVQGIAITPIDPSVAPALDEAIAAGIKVVLMDNDLPDWTGKTSVVATDNFAGGKLAGEWLATKLPQGAKIGMIAGVPGVPALDDRLKGMQEGLGAKGVTVGGDLATKCQPELGVTAAENIITANPDIAAFFAACGGPAIGAIEAIDNAGMDISRILVVGFDGAPEEFAAIEAGTEAATVVQYPSKIGEYGVETLYKALKGETVPPFVDTGTGLATKENLADFK
jgi:ABC-type sugar transport system substrate-binding protein